MGNIAAADINAAKAVSGFFIKVKNARRVLGTAAAAATGDTATRGSFLARVSLIVDLRVGSIEIKLHLRSR